MELFFELAFTISFSLLFSFCFAWFLSIADAAEHDLTKKKTSRVHKFQEEFEVCNLEMETEVGFSENKTTQFQEESKDYNCEAETAIGFSSKSVNLDDQSPELHPGKVEETEEKSLNEAQEAKTQMSFTKAKVGIEEKEEKDHNSTENKTALVHKVGICSKSVKLDDQRPELFHGKVEETEEKSVDEAQEACFTNAKMGREEKEEKEHDSNENKTAFVHYFQEEYVKLEDQRLELSPVEAEETEEKPVDESQGAETELVLIEEELGMEEKEEIGIKKIEIDSDDWVGIERSELERLFGAAVAFVDSKKEKTSSFSSDLKLQFFGLYQVAMAGPCLLPRPMALKFAARAKWDTWQQFGNMSSEVAMEHYVNLLSSNVPGWMEGNASESEISNDS